MKQWISNVYLASWMLDDPIKAAKRVGYIALALVVLFAVSAWAQPVQAATVTLECEAPTQYEDGSDILAPITYTAHYGVNPQELTQAANLGSVCGGVITVPDPAPGQSITWHFGVRAHVNGVQSVLSNVVSKTITAPFPVPNPPTGLTVQEGAQSAYVIKQTTGNISVVAVGQVQPGTACSTTDAVIADGQTYYVVPKESVSWAGSVRSELVLAQCS